MLASLCPCCFKHPTEPPQDNGVSGKDNINKNSGQNATVPAASNPNAGQLFPKEQQEGSINKGDQYTEPRIPPKITHGRGEEQQKGVHNKQENNDANQQNTRPDSSRTSIGQTRQQNGVKEEDIRKDDKNTGNLGPNSTDNQQINVVSRQESTNKNTRQNAENSNPTQQYGNVKPENSSGGLRDKWPDPEVKTGSSPEAGHLLSKEQQHGCGGLGDKRPDPLKITVTSPEGLQLLSEERKKCDLKQEIQAKQILNSAEQTGQSSVKEKQKDIVSPGPGGVNKDDKYTEHSKPFETTQARAGQSSEEQRKGVHKQESNANQQDRKLEATRNSVGQGGKLLTNDQQKGVDQQGIRKEDKNT